MKRLAWATLSMAIMLYPVAVYFALSHWGPAVLGVVLAVLVLCRSLYTWRTFTSISMLVTAAGVAYGILTALLNSALLLKYYPVLMSCGVASLFLYSLLTDTPLLERLARLRGTPVTPRAKGYLRKLTLIWALAILINGAVAALTACCAQLSLWGLYNGGLSYLAFALLFCVEWLYRQYYIRRYEDAA